MHVKDESSTTWPVQASNSFPSNDFDPPSGLTEASLILFNEQDTFGGK